MHIILVSSRLAKARSLTLTTVHLVAGAAIMALLVFIFAGALFWLSVRHVAELKLPAFESILLSAQEQQTRKTQDFLRENLNAMAVKLGEMQAQLTRLDALGDRLSTLAGIRPQEFRWSEAPGLGGAQATSVPARDLSLAEFNEMLATLSRQVENRTDMLGVLEEQLFLQTVNKKRMPTILPVDAPYNASGFGMRIDPITGQQAMHEGIDFITDVGTPVVAAAGGMVEFAGYHPQYGYVIDIDHGSELVTRYAHLSKLLVKEGAMVPRGRGIGESGNSGRSTGPHLHFEVRFKGAAQNPARFLLASNPQLPDSRDRSAALARAR